MVIISESLKTSFLLLLVALSNVQNVILHESTSVLDHMPYIDRNYPFCYIFLLNREQSLSISDIEAENFSYNCIGLFFDKEIKRKENNFRSAFLIAPDHILTVAENIFDLKNQHD